MHVRLRQAPSRLIDLVDRSCARAGTFLREDDSEEEGSAHSRASVASAKGAALATRTRAHATRVGVPAGAPAVALQDSRGPLTVLWGGSRRSYRAPRGGGHAHTQSAVPGGLPTTCDERAIGIVTEQCQCSRIRAIKALKRNGGGVVDAIMWQIGVRYEVKTSQGRPGSWLCTPLLDLPFPSARSSCASWRAEKYYKK